MYLWYIGYDRYAAGLCLGRIKSFGICNPTTLVYISDADKLAIIRPNNSPNDNTIPSLLKQVLIWTYDAGIRWSEYFCHCDRWPSFVQVSADVELNYPHFSQ